MTTMGSRSRGRSETASDMEVEESEVAPNQAFSPRRLHRLRRRLSISDLPDQLNMEILSRLPIKTLFKCRCVCKTWKTLLSNPDFTKLHLSRTPPNLMYEIYPENDDSVHLIDIRGAGTGCSRDAVSKLTRKSHFPDSFLTKSCNGLLCLSDFESMEPAYVCNPMLGEYITIPKPVNGMDYFAGFEFGFCSDTNQYKVVRTLCDAPYETEVYALGEGKWRSIGNAPSSFGEFLHLVNTHANGAVYWIDSAGGCDYIRGFLFGSERFLRISAPAELAPIEIVRPKHNHMCLGELQGCLTILCTDEDCQHLNIWALKETWTKVYVIDISLLERDAVFQSIMTMDSGEILMLFNDSAIILYSPCMPGFRTLNLMYKIQSKFSALVHVPSLISLKDVAKGEVLKVCSA